MGLVAKVRILVGSDFFSSLRSIFQSPATFTLERYRRQKMRKILHNKINMELKKELAQKSAQALLFLGIV